MRKLLILFACAVFLLSGCISQDLSVENIYREQQAKEEANKDIQEDVSEKIFDNMKSNAEKVITNISAKADEAKNNTDYPDTPEEMLDGVAKSFVDLLAYTLVGFFARLQKVAVWLCLGITLVGVILIYINKNNPVGRKWSIFLTAMGPVLFFIIVFGPALYYSLTK